MSPSRFWLFRSARIVRIWATGLFGPSRLMMFSSTHWYWKTSPSKDCWSESI